MRAALLAGLLLCTACSSHDTNRFQACTDEDEVTVQAYVVQSLRWGTVDEGFDLDGEDTYCDVGCLIDGEGGVDSRMGILTEALHESFGTSLDENCDILACNPQGEIESGDMLLLFNLTRAGEVPELDCLEASFFNGEDLDGDPGDNSSGTEQLEVCRDSIRDGGDDPIADALFHFDSGGDFETREDLSIRYTLGPIDEIVIRERLPGGSIFLLPIHSAHISLAFYEGWITGMIGGWIYFEDWVDYLMHPELLDIYEELYPPWEPESTRDSAIAIYSNQADGDLLPEGPADDECMTDDDCLIPRRTCEDGFCYEHDDRMDSISMALVFEAVPCVITGVAEE